MSNQRGAFARASDFDAHTSSAVSKEIYADACDPALSLWHSRSQLTPEILREIRRATSENVGSVFPTLPFEQRATISTSVLNEIPFTDVIDIHGHEWVIDPANDTANHARCSLMWLAALDGDVVALGLLARIIAISDLSSFEQISGLRSISALAAARASKIHLEVRSHQGSEILFEIYDGDPDAIGSVVELLPTMLPPLMETSVATDDRTTVLATNDALHSAERSLSEKFPWMAEAAQGLMRSQYLRTVEGPAPFRFPPTLLLGASGTAKTSFAYALAEETGVPVLYVSAAGKTGALEIIGSSQAYQNAQPSVGVKAIAKLGCLNPIVIVDEVDKFGQSTQNGDPYGALATMIESHTARAYLDDFTGAQVDLSLISWIFTANAAEPLQGPLLDRLEIVRVHRPTADHFPQILQRALHEIARDAGVAIESLPELSPNVVKAIRDNFRTGVSLRRVKAAIAKSLEIAARHRSA